MSTRKQTSQDTRQRVGQVDRGHESLVDFKARLAALARGTEAPGERITGAQRAHPCVVRTARDRGYHPQKKSAARSRNRTRQ